jgi:phospholipid/cholesterol/gamma-HCH transport system substrate-binding protein
VRRAIRKHLADFAAIVGLFILALATAGYILSQQRLHFPLVQKQPFTVKVDLPNAQAVTPGQGQTVRTAGVELGQIGKAELQDGHAVVELQLEPRYKGLIRRDATALLRTKTGLKDMFLEVDPGEGRPLEQDGHIPLAATTPDINPDEILSVLDSDSRNYLKLLVSGAGKGLKGRSSDLQEVFARFAPLHRDLARVSTAVARRRANLRRLIHSYGLLVEELGGKQHDLTRLVQASNAVLSAFASEGGNVSRFVAKLPRSLRTTEATLHKVDRLANRLGPTLTALDPAFRKLDTANRSVLPLAREGAPILRNQVRPFARASRPFTRNLGRAGRNLVKAGPDLTTSFHELNRLFNIAGYNSGGKEPLTGDLAKDRARDEGYLYWLAWLGQDTVSMFGVQDATGPYRRATLGGLNCGTFPAIASQAGLPTTQINALVALYGGIGACNP